MIQNNNKGFLLKFKQDRESQLLLQWWRHSIVFFTKKKLKLVTLKKNREKERNSNKFIHDNIIAICFKKRKSLRITIL